MNEQSQSCNHLLMFSLLRKSFWFNTFTKTDFIMSNLKLVSNTISDFTDLILLMHLIPWALGRGNIVNQKHIISRKYHNIPISSTLPNRSTNLNKCQLFFTLSIIELPHKSTILSITLRQNRNTSKAMGCCLMARSLYLDLWCFIIVSSSDISKFLATFIWSQFHKRYLSH